MKNKLHTFFLLSLVGICPLTSYSQFWTHTYGGLYNEEGYSARQTFDGDYIITGYTSPVNSWNSDLWLIKTDGNGDTLWTKTYGGANNDEGTDIQQTTDNGYIITGYTSSFGAGSIDVWLLKTDSDGDTLWTKTFGGTNNDFGNSVIQTDDGGYTIIGSTESFGTGGSDFWVIKTNASGDSLWSKTYGGFYHEIAFEGQPTSDGGYIIAGYKQLQGFTNADFWLVKLFNNGEIEWTKTFGGDFDDLAYSVQETADAGYIVTGYTKSYGSGYEDLWLIKTDMYGDSIWTKTFGGISMDAGNSVFETEEGDFLVCGYTFSFSANGDADLWLIKTDISGYTLWTKTYGGSGAEVGYAVIETFDGGLTVCGFTSSYGAGDKDVWLLHLSFDGQTGLDRPDLQSAMNFNLEQNFPNPFYNETVINYTVPKPGHLSLNVYDLRGSQVATMVNEYKNAGNYSITFNSIGLKDGIYFYRLQSGTLDSVKKFILAR